MGYARPLLEGDESAFVVSTTEVEGLENVEPEVAISYGIAGA